MSDNGHGEWLHHSIDSLGVSLCAPVGFLAEPLGDERVLLWHGTSDDDERTDRDTTVEFRRTGMTADAAAAVLLSGFGRSGLWTDVGESIVDGLSVPARGFSSDGLGGPMRGLLAYVDGPFPLVIRAEWPVTDNRSAEIMTMLSTIRMTSVLDPIVLPAGRRSSLTSPNLTLSVELPDEVEVIEHLERFVLRGDGWLWVLARAEHDLEVRGTLSTGGVVVNIDSSGEHLAAAVAAGGSRYRVVAEGMDPDLFRRLVESLRYHQFLAV